MGPLGSFLYIYIIMMNIVILGAPGSGKGTMCKRLVEEFDYKFISAGDILRSEKSTGSELGKKIGKIIDKGNLLPDPMVTKIIYNEIRKGLRINQAFLIDGYPRSIKQATSLDQMINVSVVIWLNVPDEITIERNTRRGRMGSGRPDDSSDEIIKKRLNNFKEVSLPVKNWYGDRIVEIDATGTVDEVYKRITDTLFDTVKDPKDLSDIV